MEYFIIMWVIVPYCDAGLCNNDLQAKEKELLLYFNSQHVNGTIYRHIVCLVGYLGRHQKTNMDIVLIHCLLEWQNKHFK